MRRDFVETLWSEASQKSQNDEFLWKSSARQKLNAFESQLLEAVDAGVKSYSGQTTWTFINAIVYSISLITTTGKFGLLLSRLSFIERKPSDYAKI